MPTAMRITRPMHRRAALLAAAIACFAIAIPLGSAAAQDAAPPAPASPAVCPSCDSASDARADGELARATAALERAQQALIDAMKQAMASQDSSGATAEKLARANGDLRRAQQRYEQLTSDLMRRRLARERIDIDRATRKVQGQVGYLGVTLSMVAPEMQHEGGKTIMRFEDYPTIESVDPDSPAERAGLESGDKLLALNGKDVTAGCEPFSALLKPGSRVLLSVKRGAYTKQLSALVAKRPATSWGQVWTSPHGGATTIVIPSMPTVPYVRVAPAPPAAPAPDAAADSADVSISITPFPSMSPTPEMPAMVTRVGASLLVVAGAEVRPVGNLADYFGVRQGVLVLRVESGTVAARSGLQDGDVIVRADGNPVSTPAALSRAMYHASDTQLKLDIVRLKKKKSVLLKWDR